eukprot:7971317-Karenia_brevis.AAC.1
MDDGSDDPWCSVKSEAALCSLCSETSPQCALRRSLAADLLCRSLMCQAGSEEGGMLAKSGQACEANRIVQGW